MTKTDAIRVFGTRTKLAAALGITKQAISLWPEELDTARADRVRGAALRTNRVFELTEKDRAA